MKNFGHFCKNALLAITLFSSAANASIVSINGEIDTSTISSGSSVSFLYGLSFASPVAISDGDQVDLTVSFTQAIAMTGNGSDGFWAALWAIDNNSDFTIDNAVLTLTGLTGTLANPISDSGAQSSGHAHIGAFYSDNFIGDGNTITFTGFNETFNVVSISPNGTDSYYSPFLQVSSGSISAIVPEPETYMMFVIGLFGLAASIRKRA